MDDRILAAVMPEPEQPAELFEHHAAAVPWQEIGARVHPLGVASEALADAEAMRAVMLDRPVRPRMIPA